MMSAWWMCVLLLTAISAQVEEEDEATEEESPKTSSGPRKPAFQEPSYSSGDVSFVETSTVAAKVRRRSCVA